MTTDVNSINYLWLHRPLWYTCGSSLVTRVWWRTTYWFSDNEGYRWAIGNRHLSNGHWKV